MSTVLPLPLRSPEPRARRVVVVGGGAAGVLVAVHLLRAASRAAPVDVQLVERGREVGPGLAYATPHWCHTVNNFAGRLSAVDGDPDHLLRWCRARGEDVDAFTFLPRRRYGDYLASLLHEVAVPAGSGVRVEPGEVVDVRPAAAGAEVVLASGQALPADAVVLALGNPPPRRLPAYEPLGERYVADPWAVDLVARARGARRVLLLGTGLTMLDVVALLAGADPDVRVTAASRGGLLPQAHGPRFTPPPDDADAWGGSLDDVLATFAARVAEAEAAGGSWRDVVDAVRCHANRLWRAFPDADQDRFVAEVARRWDTARHRMTPRMAADLRRWTADGTLELRGTGGLDPAGYDLVVNCTGPRPVPSPGWNPVVDRLLARGALRPNRFGLGLDLDAEGRVVDAAGSVTPWLFAVGAARRGVDWEVAAIPDLRAQAAELATLLVAGLPTATVAAPPAEGRPDVAPPALVAGT